jgi:hypothetical protein
MLNHHGVKLLGRARSLQLSCGESPNLVYNFLIRHLQDNLIGSCARLCGGNYKENKVNLCGVGGFYVADTSQTYL